MNPIIKTIVDFFSFPKKKTFTKSETKSVVETKPTKQGEEEVRLSEGELSIILEDWKKDKPVERFVKSSILEQIESRIIDKSSIFKTREDLLDFIESEIGDEWVAHSNQNKILAAYAERLMASAKKEVSKEIFDKFFATYDPVKEDTSTVIKMGMIYDCYTGEHAPKLFDVEENLWDMLVNTDIKNISAADVKMPFDTMIINFNRKFVVNISTLITKDFLDMDIVGKESSTATIDSMIVTTDGKDFMFYFPFVSASLLEDVNKKFIFVRCLGLKMTDIHKINDEMVKAFEKLETEYAEDWVHEFAEVGKKCMVGFVNLLLYITSVDKKVSEIKKKRLPSVFKNRDDVNSSLQSFYVQSTIYLSNKHTSSNGTGAPMMCPKWDVMGHWRMQACGKNMKEHRRVWIQPYTKGKFRKDKKLASVPRDYSTNN